VACGNAVTELRAFRRKSPVCLVVIVAVKAAYAKSTPHSSLLDSPHLVLLERIAAMRSYKQEKGLPFSEGPFLAVILSAAKNFMAGGAGMP